MITGEYEQLKDLADNNQCAADSGVLSVAWHQEKGCYYLRCGVCGETKGIKRVLGLLEAHKAGEELPPAIKDKVTRRPAKKPPAPAPAPLAEKVEGVPTTDLGTGELLTWDQLEFLVKYAVQYGLDPRRGHVCMMYSKPYITIDGYLYHAKDTDEPYILDSRPLSEDEKKLYMFELDSHAWIATLSNIRTGAYKTGLGVVTKAETEEKSKRDPERLAAPVVARHPWQLAQKRAEWQALRREFPIGETPEDLIEAGDES